VRRFIFNAGFISALFGGWGAIKASRRGPHDWRLVLLWVSWALAVAIAVGNVLEEAQEAQDDLEHEREDERKQRRDVGRQAGKRSRDLAGSLRKHDQDLDRGRRN